MRLGVCAAMAAFGCGRLEFGVVALDATTTGDALSSDGQAACTWGPWQTPMPVQELDVGPDNMGDPAVRADGLEIVVAVSTGGSGGDELFHARRGSVAEAFSGLTPLAALNTNDLENGPAFGSDGLTLYWTNNTSGYRLWRATRADTSLTFSNPELVPGGPFVEQTDPSITADGLELFHSSTFGDLYVATRATPDADFELPVLLGTPIASTRWQEGTAISADGTTLYYAEADSSGLFNLWVSTRPDRTSAFETPSMLTALLPDQAWDPELSADGKTLYFSRFVSGERDIWVTRRSCL